MIFEEYRKEKLKINKSRNTTINNSYGLRDAYRWCIKNKMFNKSITEPIFSTIITTINQSLQDRLLDGFDVKFPYRMGGLIIKKYPTYINFENEKLKTNLKVDWKETLKLWYTDHEAEKSKTLIRCETDEKFKIYYMKSNALYSNRTFYNFIVTRDLKHKLKEKINKQGFDALLLIEDYGLRKYKYNSRQNS